MMQTAEYETWIAELKAKLAILEASIASAIRDGNEVAARMMRAQAASYQYQLASLEVALNTMRNGKGRGS